MKILLSSEEVNVLIYRYLLENGFVHSAFSFSSEANLASNATWSAHGASLFPNALIAFLQKALLYLWIEYHTDDESGSEIPCSQAFAFFRRHECWYNSDAEGSVMRPALEGGGSTGATRTSHSQGNSGIGGASRRTSSTGGGNNSTSGVGGNDQPNSHGHQQNCDDGKGIRGDDKGPALNVNRDGLTLRQSRRSCRPSSPRNACTEEGVETSKAFVALDADSIPTEYVASVDAVTYDRGDAAITIESVAGSYANFAVDTTDTTAPSEIPKLELVSSGILKGSCDSVASRAKRASEPLFSGTEIVALPSSKRLKRRSSPNPDVDRGRCSSSVSKGVLSVKSADGLRMIDRAVEISVTSKAGA